MIVGETIRMCCPACSTGAAKGSPTVARFTVEAIDDGIAKLRCECRAVRFEAVASSERAP